MNCFECRVLAPVLFVLRVPLDQVNDAMHATLCQPCLLLVVPESKAGLMKIIYSFASISNLLSMIELFKSSSLFLSTM